MNWRMIRYCALTVLLLAACTPEKPVVLTPQPTPSHSPSSTATVIMHVR